MIRRGRCLAYTARLIPINELVPKCSEGMAASVNRKGLLAQKFGSPLPSLGCRTSTNPKAFGMRRGGVQRYAVRTAKARKLSTAIVRRIFLYFGRGKYLCHQLAVENWGYNPCIRVSVTQKEYPHADMCKIESAHSTHNPAVAFSQYKMLKTLLKCNSKPFFHIQDLQGIFLYCFSHCNFAFVVAGYIFRTYGTQKLIGPVCQGPVQDLDQEGELLEEPSQEIAFTCCCRLWILRRRQETRCHTCCFFGLNCFQLLLPLVP